LPLKIPLKHIRMSDGKRKGNVGLLNWIKKILTKSAILIIAWEYACAKLPQRPQDRAPSLAQWVWVQAFTEPRINSVAVKANISEKEKNKWNHKKYYHAGTETREWVTSEMKSFRITVAPLFRTKASVPWIVVSPEWRLGLGFVNNQPKNKIIFFFVFCLGFCCSHSKVMSKNIMINLFFCDIVCWIATSPVPAI